MTEPEVESNVKQTKYGVPVDKVVAPVMVSMTPPDELNLINSKVLSTLNCQCRLAAPDDPSRVTICLSPLTLSGMIQAVTEKDVDESSDQSPVLTWPVLPSMSNRLPMSSVCQTVVPKIVPSFPLVLISVAVVPLTCVRGQNPTHDVLIA